MIKRSVILRNIFSVITAMCFGKFAFAQIYPAYTVTAYDTASAGYYFCVPIITGFNSFSNHMILDDKGRVVYTKLFQGGNAMDFKIQPNGLMSYFSGTQFYLMDSTFTVVDSVVCGNGIHIDSHDLQILSNGHFLMLGYEYITMDLSSYHLFNHNNSPGSSNALVRCGVIQEQDANHNVVFEWHTKDHFAFGDVDSFFLGSPVNVDWTHCNAVELDDDGNILLSSRHLDEITKINRSDSSIIWRMGGNANQFNFTNDIAMFRGQHDIRRIANGDLTLNDNGRTGVHPASAKEYRLDTNLMTATLVWSYTEDSASSSLALGDVCRLPNGNTLIDNGNTPNKNLAFMVVDSVGNKHFEITFQDTLRTYRAFNYLTLPWALHRPQISCFTSGSQLYLDAGPGYGSYIWSNGATTQIIPVNNPDTFSVFVPYGQGGFICSDYLFIPNPSTYCLSLGENNIPENEFSISPNPVTDELGIYLPGVQNKTVTIEVYNSAGQKTISDEMIPTENKINISVSDLPGGIYFVRLNGNGKKFLKM